MMKIIQKLLVALALKSSPCPTLQSNDLVFSWERRRRDKNSDGNK